MAPQRLWHGLGLAGFPRYTTGLAQEAATLGPTLRVSEARRSSLQSDVLVLLNRQVPQQPAMCGSRHPLHSDYAGGDNAHALQVTVLISHCVLASSTSPCGAFMQRGAVYRDIRNVTPVTNTQGAAVLCLRPPSWWMTPH